MRLLAKLGLLAAALFLIACDSTTPVAPEPQPSPTPTPLAQSCQIKDPILLTMDVKGEQRQVFFLGEVPVFRAHPIYLGDEDEGFDRNDCPGVWDWSLFDEAAAGCRQQGSEGFGTMRLDCHVAGFLTVRACIQDISGASRCGNFFSEAKGE